MSGIVKVNVVKGRNLKSSKAEGGKQTKDASYYVHLQGSTGASESVQAVDGLAEFNFKSEITLPADEDQIINFQIKLQIYESLGKDKSALQCQLDLPLFSPQLFGTLIARSEQQQEKISTKVSAKRFPGKAALCEDVEVELELECNIQSLFGGLDRLLGANIWSLAVSATNLSGDVIKSVADGLKPLKFQVLLPAIGRKIEMHTFLGRDNYFHSSSSSLKSQSVGGGGEEKVCGQRKCLLDSSSLSKLTSADCQDLFFLLQLSSLADVKYGALIDSNSILSTSETLFQLKSSLIQLSGNLSIDQPAALISFLKGASAKSGSHQPLVVDLTLTLERPLLSKKRIEPIPFESIKDLPQFKLCRQLAVESQVKSARSLLQDKLNAIIYQLAKLEEQKRQQLKDRFDDHHNDAADLDVLKLELSNAIKIYAKYEYFESSVFYAPQNYETFKSKFHSKLSSLVHGQVTKAFGANEGNFAIDYQAGNGSNDQGAGGEFKMLLQVAADLEEERKWEDCELVYLDLVHLQPLSERTWVEQAKYWHRRRLLDKAKVCINEVFNRNPSSIEGMLILAALKFETNEILESFGLVTRILELDQGNLVAQAFKAVIHESVDEIDDAQKCWHKITMNGGDICRLAKIFRELGAYKVSQMLSAKMLLRTAADEQDETEAYLSIAEHLMQLGDFLGCNEHLTTARRKNPRSMQLLEKQAACCYFDGKLEEARQLYETFFSMLTGDPNSAKSFERFAITLMKQQDQQQNAGDLELSRSLLLKSLRKQNSYTAWEALGDLCLQHLRNAVEAEQAYKEANVMRPRNGQLWIKIAIAAVFNEKLNEANQAVKKGRQYIQQPVSRTEDLKIIKELEDAYRQMKFEKAADSLKEVF